MLILSVRQPWVWAIMKLGKGIENRSWTTKVRGRILVHASSRCPTWDDVDDFIETAIWAGIKAHELATALTEATPKAIGCEHWRHLPRGGIVGSVEIVDVVQESSSPWFFGPFGFVLRDPRPIPFIPLRGQLGFWKADDAVMDQVRRAA